ncbi:hypothetical protein [Candidatus Raskinella chloraquaticus]
MASAGRLGMVSCVIALSGLAMTGPVSAQPMYGPAIIVPGPDGVLWLDEPRRGYAARGRHAFHDDAISQRYLDGLARRKIKRPVVHARRVRTADAAPQVQPSVPVQPAAPAPVTTESIKPKDDKAKDDTDALREQIARLGADTQALRGEIATLKGELSKRIAAAEQRPEPPKTTATANSDELVKVKEEAARLKDETTRLRGEGDALRDQLAKLATETGGLKTSVAALRDELAKRPVAPPKAEEPRNDELPKVKEEATRVREETTRLRGESDQLRELVAKLAADTGTLRGEIASLKDELAKRPANANGAVTGKVEQQIRKDEPLRRTDSLKKGGTTDNKVVERAPGGEEREAGVMEKAWRRLLDMMGRKSAP